MILLLLLLLFFSFQKLFFLCYHVLNRYMAHQIVIMVITWLCICTSKRSLPLCFWIFISLYVFYICVRLCFFCFTKQNYSYLFKYMLLYVFYVYRQEATVYKITKGIMIVREFKFHEPWG